MAALESIDVNDTDALIAAGLAAGRDAEPSLFQLRVLAACLAAEAPNGGFCVAAGDIRADRCNGGWRLSGAAPASLSTFEAAKHCIALATDPAGEAGRLSFLLPSNAAGVRVAAVSSIDLLPACDVTFDGAFAAESSLLRRVGGNILAPALLALCAEMTGAAGAALDMALERARSRKVFGRAIGAYQALAHRLVDAKIDLESMQLALEELALEETAQAGEDGGGLRAMALKALCSSAGPRIVATAQQVHGGEGFHADLPLHRHTRRVHGLSLRLGGASRQLAELRRRIASSS